MPSGKRAQEGFTYLMAMMVVALLGTGLAAYGEAASRARDREKLAELRWIGGQFREAIGLYYQRTPGMAKSYPLRLEDLLEDKRFLSRQRYLRRVYRDPFTSKADWGLVPAPQGGIMGVYSLTDGRPGGEFVYVPKRSSSTAPRPPYSLSRIASIDEGLKPSLR